ncbi:MAG: hydrogenase nickel incorporation protein HypB [Deltaproteobacteria bacterium]|nr:hydrogenase nickel incorporation protein HypB [Deltaproteobacteria bacterium]
MCDHCGCGHPDGPVAEGDGTGQTISIQQDVLAHDRAYAAQVRARLAELDARMVNFVGGPGCGKTELLAKLIARWGERLDCVVVEGDLATDNDAERIRAAGAPVHQIQTGTVCHLTAHDVGHALTHLPLERRTAVLVENVGNLVCPSMFDLGESLRIVCLSVTEGADKPQKYPVAFREASLVVLTKMDLLPHVDFDVEACIGFIHDLKPDLPCLVTSAWDGTGLDQLGDTIARLWDEPA